MNEALTLEQWENRLSKRKREHRELTEEIAEIESSIAFARAHFSAEDRQRMELDRLRLEALVGNMLGKFAVEQARILAHYALECGITLTQAMARYTCEVSEEVE